MKRISVCLFVPLLVISLLPCKNTEASNDLITTSCEKTMYKELCTASLRSDKDSSGSDLQGLGKISLKITLANANEIHGYISELLKKDGKPFLQQCLKDCSKNLQDAILEIKDSIAAIDSRSYSDVNTWVSAAMSYEESCEDGFKEKPGFKSPLTQMNAKFSQLCSISLTISNLLAGKA